MTTEIRSRRVRGLLAAPATVGLVLALSACGTASEPETTPTPDDLYSAEAAVEAAITKFFVYVDVGESEAAAEERTDLSFDLESDLALLLTPDVSVNVEDRPKLLDIQDISVSADEESAEATVTYEMAGAEITDQVEVERTAEHEDKPDDYVLVLPKDAVGFDPTGAELLPPETTYTIGLFDVSAAFQEAVGWADTDGSLPRLPAFGGTYPIEITVPGDGGFTDTLTLQTSTFYGGTDTDGALEEFAHGHGY